MVWYAGTCGLISKDFFDDEENEKNIVIGQALSLFLSSVIF